MTFSRTHLVAAALGAGLGVVLWGANYSLGRWAVPSSDSAWPSWFAGTQSLIEATASVAPGLLAGWLAKTHGMAVGALAGAMLALASLALVTLLWGFMPFATAIQFVFFATLTNLITQSFAGLAGEVLHSRRDTI